MKGLIPYMPSSVIKNSNPSPSVTYFDSYLRYTSIQDKHRKGYSIKTGLSPYLSRFPLSSTEVIFESISVPVSIAIVLFSLNCLSFIDEGEYLRSSFQQLKIDLLKCQI
jgi:hypothetical protein